MIISQNFINLWDAEYSFLCVGMRSTISMFGLLLWKI